MKNWELFHLLGVLCITVITTVDGRHGSGSSKEDNSHHHHHHHRVHHYRHGATMARCSKCLPGHYAFKQCEGSNDTECQACPSDTYSPHHTFRHACFVCSRCGEGLYVARPCVPTRDTVCDSCHTYRGPHNKDYREKCLGVKGPFKEAKKHATKSSRLSINSLQVEDIPSHLPYRSEKLVSHPLLEDHIAPKTSVGDSGETEVKTGPAISSLTIAFVSCLLFMSVVVIAITFRWCWRKRKVTSDGRTYTAVETMEIVAL